MDGKDSFIGRLLGSAEKFSTEQVAQTIQLLLEHGVQWQASDIHIEPHDQFVQVRYRVDGELKGAHKITRAALTALTHELKAMAHLDVSSSHVPQNGHFTATAEDHTFTVKLSVMPVLGGEKLVLHLTPKIREPYKLSQLGFWGSSLQALQASLARSHGMVIVSAPKHHGRPTTEASMLAALNNPALNIATIEESVEYRIPHASQTTTNHRAGLTMLTGLQAALHQDPNVLLVGNLPDKATTELAIQTAMSGHLVVAGMHSDSSTSALLHLRAMHIPPYLLASTIRTVIAQRLVRQLCEKCRERYELTTDQLALLERVFGIGSASAFRRINQLENQAIELGMGHTQQANSTASKITHLWRPHREGCEHCNHTGYDGRVAIVEVLPMNEGMQSALLDDKGTASSIQARALKDGFVPLALDGLIKALRGVVTIKDVLHVVDRSLRHNV
jgi:type II secretory ATPase GspE/PulE/Tfp pilus assembly ATPase PilB-like protein